MKRGTVLKFQLTAFKFTSDSSKRGVRFKYIAEGWCFRQGIGETGTRVQPKVKFWYVSSFPAAACCFRSGKFKLLRLSITHVLSECDSNRVWQTPSKRRRKKWNLSVSGSWNSELCRKFCSKSVCHPLVKGRMKIFNRVSLLKERDREKKA